MVKFFRKIQVFLEMIKFEHSIFALPFAYLGLFLAARGWPQPDKFLWVTVAMVSFRTLGMGLNRIIDRAIDHANPRTSQRALPAGLLTPGFVWAMSLFCLAVFEGAASRLNPLCLRLSWIPVLLAFLYPWLKRFTWLSHWILGIILGIAPYGAWLAVRESFSWIPGFLTLGVTAWVAGFDILYALQDETFDRTYGLFSIPSRFGQKVSLWLVKVLHLAAFLFWLSSGFLAGLGDVFFFGMMVIAVFLIRENWLVHRFGLEKLGQAFFTTNAVVSILIFVFVFLDLIF
ncbi:MAG: UbiA family prenyltransferase [Candidatus Omnitrophica bacterium]|nr:UbiA family prenyltransferase [Candidatus Omnitrophota bacterium]